MTDSSHINVLGCAIAGQPRDLTEFRVDLVAPAGAIGFSFDHNFLAADYPEWVCTAYSDGFLAVVESSTVGVMNVAFDSLNSPVTLNTAFFAAGSGAPQGTGPLNGTGYQDGGATMWNTASVPASGGESIAIRFFIYDANDSGGDSTVLLDHFQWTFAPTDPPIANAGPDQTVSTLSGSGTVTLSGAASSDPEGGALTYGWTGAFGSASGPTPAVTLPVGVHVITLTVTDPLGASASDTVTVTILDGTPSLNDTIAGLLAAISTQGATLASHDATIAALQAAVAALQSTIASLQATVAALQTSLLGILDHPIMNSVPQAGPKK